MRLLQEAWTMGVRCFWPASLFPWSRSPSGPRERLYTRPRRLHARIVNVRNDVHHKATTAIAKSAGLVVIEDLNVRGMMSNRSLAAAFRFAAR